MEFSFGNLYDGLRTREALTNTTVQAPPDTSYQEYEAARQRGVRSDTDLGGLTPPARNPRRSGPSPTPGMADH